MIKRLLREPLLHFVLLGGMLFAAQPWWARLFTAPTITVTAQDQQRLIGSWLRETGRRPSAEETRALINQHVDEELLLHEAHRLGLHQRDTVVRNRLIRNMRFAAQDMASPDDALLAAAIGMGMTRTDLVVRRRLVQRMQHHIESGVSVTEGEALARYAQQPLEWQQQARYSYRHIYFESPDNQEVTAVRQALQQGLHADQLGDPFLLGQHFRHQTQAEIEAQLGSDMAQLISSAEPGQWFGPVTSIYGKHLVLVDQRQPASVPAYARLRRQLAAKLYAEKEKQALSSRLADLRAGYRLLIEGQDS